MRARHLISNVDRHGNKRVYVYVKGQPKIRLRAAPGTPLFWSEYRTAMTKMGKRPWAQKGNKSCPPPPQC